MLIHSVQQYSQLTETCTCQSLFHEFLEDETLLQEHFCESIGVHPEYNVNFNLKNMQTKKYLRKDRRLKAVGEDGMEGHG